MNNDDVAMTILLSAPTLVALGVQGIRALVAHHEVTQRIEEEARKERVAQATKEVREDVVEREITHNLTQWASFRLPPPPVEGQCFDLTCDFDVEVVGPSGRGYCCYHAVKSGEYRSTMFEVPKS